MRTSNVGECMFARQEFDVADVVIQPEVGNVPWFDFPDRW